MSGRPGAGSDGQVAGLLFVAAGCLYVATMFGTTENPDAEVEYQTSRALAREGSLAIGETAAGRAILERRFDVRQGTDGRWYSWFGVGRAALGVPFLLAGKGLAALFPDLARSLASERRSLAGEVWESVPDEEPLEHLAFAAQGPIAAAGCVALVFLLARALGASSAAGFVASGLFGAGTFLLAHARSSLSDAIGAFFLLLALTAAVRSGEGATRFSALAGLGAGLAVAVRPIALLYVPPLALYLATRRTGLRSLLAAVAPGVVVGAVLVATNLSRFGSPLEFGYGAAVGSGSFFSFPLWLGLLGLLFSPGRGLVPYAPPVLLAVPGTRALSRSGRKAEAWLLLGTVACVLLPPSFTETWHGAWCYGPRYALPAVGPLVAIGALALESNPARRAAVTLGALGSLLSLPALLVPYTVGIARGNAIVAAEHPEAPENSRFLYLVFQPRLAPPVLHARLLGETRARDHLVWARLAASPGHGGVLLVPFALLAASAAAWVRARRLVRASP